MEREMKPQRGRSDAYYGDTDLDRSAKRFRSDYPPTGSATQLPTTGREQFYPMQKDRWYRSDEPPPTPGSVLRGDSGSGGPMEKVSVSSLNRNAYVVVGSHSSNDDIASGSDFSDGKFLQQRGYPRKGGDTAGGRQGSRNMLPEEDKMATRTLFVGNLESDIKEEEIRRVFERYGTVEDVDIKQTQAHSTYAFVQFASLDQSYSAKTDLHGYSVRRQACKIGYGKPVPYNVIWMGGLGPRVRPDQAKRDVELITGRPVLTFDWPEGRNYALVGFESTDAAASAIHLLRGKDFGEVGRLCRADFAGGTVLAHAAKLLQTDGGGNHGNQNQRYGNGRTEELVRSNTLPVGGEQGNRSARSHNEGVRKEEEELEAVDLRDTASFAEIALRAPVVWCGALAMKSSEFMTRMHLLGGDSHFAHAALRGAAAVGGGKAPVRNGGGGVLRFNQRLRMEEPKLDEVEKKMSVGEKSNSLAVLLALPLATGEASGGAAASAGGAQRRPLQSLTAYLKQKDSAGVVTFDSEAEGVQQGLLYAFPACTFAQKLLRVHIPLLLDRDADSDGHLVIVIAKQ